MLIVPHLAWPILFGQNHLRMLRAHTDHAGLRVRFDHSNLNFTITCCNENPSAAFPSLAKQNSSTSQGTASCTLPGTPQTTCLLTLLPPPTQSWECVTLQCRFNVVSFCLLLASSLADIFLLAGPMW